jgi:hypothetical protein
MDRSASDLSANGRQGQNLPRAEIAERYLSRREIAAAYYPVTSALFPATHLSYFFANFSPPQISNRHTQRIAWVVKLGSRYGRMSYGLSYGHAVHTSANRIADCSKNLDRSYTLICLTFCCHHTQHRPRSSSFSPSWPPATTTHTHATMQSFLPLPSICISHLNQTTIYPYISLPCWNGISASTSAWL